jgi:hypothetical protein
MAAKIQYFTPAAVKSWSAEMRTVDLLPLAAESGADKKPSKVTVDTLD